MSKNDTMLEESDELEKNRCPECGSALHTAPDKTVACSWCGLVIGQGYSLLYGVVSAVPAIEEEDTEWNGILDNAEMLLDKLGV